MTVHSNDTTAKTGTDARPVSNRILDEADSAAAAKVRRLNTAAPSCVPNHRRIVPAFFCGGTAAGKQMRGGGENAWRKWKTVFSVLCLLYAVVCITKYVFVNSAIEQAINIILENVEQGNIQAKNLSGVLARVDALNGMYRGFSALVCNMAAVLIVYLTGVYCFFQKIPHKGSSPA